MLRFSLARLLFRSLVVRVNSDIAEMVPVLQMAGSRHRNIQQPT